MRKPSQHQLSWAVAVFLFGAPSLGVHAQGTFVVPPEVASTEGDAFQLLSGGHDQQLIHSGAFPAIPATGVLLTGISFRLDVAQSGARGGVYAFSKFDLNASTSPAAGPLGYFVPGADNTLVFAGPITFTVPNPPPNGPSEFNLAVPFQTPLLYLPGRSLLIDLNTVPSAGGPPLDATHSGNIDLIVQSSGFPNRFLGQGFAIQVTFSPIPEPQHVGLLCTVVLLLSFVARRKEAP